MHVRLSRTALAAVSAGVLTVGASAALAVGAAAHNSHGHGRNHAPGRAGNHASGTAGKHAAGTPQKRAAGCATISKATWGSLSLSQDPNNGASVDLYTLTNGNGMKVQISDFGGIVESIWVPDKAHGLRNVALGFPATQAGLTQYETMFFNPPAGGSGNTYFGAIIGRYANRIAGASFPLNGTTYTLPANNGPNTLHGGPDAYNAQIWSASTPTTPCNSVALQLQYTDPNGKNGFPAQVSNTVTYTLTNRNALQIHYDSHNDDSSLSTVINLTNHTYFNLAGEGSGDVFNQLLQINADKFQPTDANLIPTGFADVAGTPFDFRRMKPIGRDILDASAPEGDQLTTAHGYDHNWVLNGSGYRLAAIANDPGSGITLSTFTDQPGVQMYSGNFLVGDLVGTSGHTYRQSDGFTLETQHFPDTPHHQGDPAWPSVVLPPNGTFTSNTAYAFTVAGHGVAAMHRHRRG
jgi:aldose 1-epimerase